MVLKRSNCSANSGGTLRIRAFKRDMLRYQPELHTVIKLVRNIPNSRPTYGEQWAVDAAKTYVDDGLVDHRLTSVGRFNFYTSTPVYSLNKRQRWNLESEMHNACDDQLAQEPYKITFVKREALVLQRRQAQDSDVVAYYDSHCQQTQTLPKKTHSFRSDLLHKAKKITAVVKKSRRRPFHNQHFRGVQRKRTHSQGNQTEADNRNETADDRIPEIRYDVTVPQPLSAQNLAKPRKWDCYHFKGHARRWWVNRRTYSRTRCRFRGVHCDQLRWYFPDNEAAKHVLERGSTHTDNHDYSEDVAETETDFDIDLEEDYAPPRAQEFSLLDFATATNKSRHTRVCKSVSSDTTSSTSAVNTASDQRVKKHGKGSAIFLADRMEEQDDDEAEEDFTFVSRDIDTSRDSGLSSDGDSDLDLGVSLQNSAYFSSNIDYDAEFVQLDDSFTRYEIPNSELSHECLHARFGNGVQFATCVPFTFVISLPDAVNMRHEDRKEVDFGDADWRLVCQVAPSSCTNKEAQLVALRLQGSSSEEVVTAANKELKQRKDAGILLVTSLDSIVMQTCRIITHLSHKRQKTDIMKPSAGTHTAVPRAAASLPYGQFVGSAAVCSMQEAYSQLQNTHMTSTAVDVPCTSLHAFDWEVDLECSICFSLYGEEPGSEATFSMFVCLMTCGHGFCRRCWQHHLVSGIMNGQTTFSCMEYKCKTVIDTATVMSLVPDWAITRWQERVQNFAVESSGQWKWCPNARCGRLASAQSLPSEVQSGDRGGLPVECACQRQWCLDCGHDPHWPISCQQFDSYRKMLQQKGDEDGLKTTQLVITYVSVKCCPGCRYPLEKNGGCSHMNCSRCQKSFCWVCLADWSDHMTGNWTGCTEKKEETWEIDNSKVPLPIEFYRKAVEHRYAWKQLDRQWQHSAAGFVNLFALMMTRKTNAAHITSESVTYILDALRFVRMAHVLLELSYILLSNTRRSNRLAKQLRADLQVLEFSCSRITQYLEQPRTQVFKSAMKLHSMTDAGHHSLNLICRRAHRLKSKVKATTQEWLLKGDPEKFVRFK